MSTDHGERWVGVSPPGFGEITGIAAIESGVFVARNQYVRSSLGVGNVGVYLTTNGGISWTSISEGLPAPGREFLARLFVNGSYIYATIDSSGVWRRPLSQILTAVQATSDGTYAGQFGLDQNYPNPFNPVTTLSFRLPSRSFVSSRVFDALGREIATLAPEDMSAGSHSFKWGANALPSGMYYYRLQSGGFTETRKAVFLK
jgi:hypothetical protein